jgi:hypothetical protein
MGWQIACAFGFVLLVVLAVMIVPHFFPMPAPARWALSGGAVPSAATVANRCLRYQAMFSAYRLTGDSTIFPRGSGWFWCGYGKRPPDATTAVSTETRSAEPVAP